MAEETREHIRERQIAEIRAVAGDSFAEEYAKDRELVEQAYNLFLQISPVGQLAFIRTFEDMTPLVELRAMMAVAAAKGAANEDAGEDLTVA